MTKRRKRHSPEQIIRKLRDADSMLSAGQTIWAGVPVAGDQRADLPPLAEPVRWHEAEEAKRLKELEQENSRLKKLLAEAQLDKEKSCRRR